jgi:hypothetical protein
VHIVFAAANADFDQMPGYQQQHHKVLETSDTTNISLHVDPHPWDMTKYSHPKVLDYVWFPHITDRMNKTDKYYKSGRPRMCDSGIHIDSDDVVTCVVDNVPINNRIHIEAYTTSIPNTLP